MSVQATATAVASDHHAGTVDGWHQYVLTTALLWYAASYAYCWDFSDHGQPNQGELAAWTVGVLNSSSYKALGRALPLVMPS